MQLKVLFLLLVALFSMVKGSPDPLLGLDLGLGVDANVDAVVDANVDVAADIGLGGGGYGSKCRSGHCY
ncbi:hypothetical protein CEXT_42561 [Caerostris extrusa]|uniref:Uncharacterized protein n=1 Tax=Caerostris extrusa TaxID=172846 RepID=A0AAV4STT0_CAEEX|nr:hypothetical protein CEXT_42561 [Caerostris extrusa]